MLYEVRVVPAARSVEVLDSNGRVVLQIAGPSSGSWVSGQVDESANEVHLRSDSGHVEVYDLRTGIRR